MWPIHGPYRSENDCGAQYPLLPEQMTLITRADTSPTYRIPSIKGQRTPRRKSATTSLLPIPLSQVVVLLRQSLA